MNVDRSRFLVVLGIQDSHQDKVENAVHSAPPDKLYEEFEGCLRDNAADPGAKMVHFADTPADFTAVVSSVWFPILAVRAPDRTTVALADEYVVGEEILKAGPLFVGKGAGRGAGAGVSIAGHVSSGFRLFF